ncbi:MAG: DNA-3-methyladenine glycosylase I [Propionibacteriaceae bacterium]|nr:DNA-3-methyladenine glycosylase I [Propionibacteriaceae bacterium]
MAYDTSLPDPTIDPRLRCFGGADPLYQAYHDWEWGTPVHGDTALFERLSLEVFAAGLSWFTVLRKREAFRSAFDGFNPSAIASYGAADVDRLLADKELVRNRRKIEATIANARWLTGFQAAGGSLDALVWGFAPNRPQPPRSFAAVPSRSPESEALAQELKRLGWRWIGPVIAYATMQACGIVNDHLERCPRSQGCARHPDASPTGC